MGMPSEGLPRVAIVGRPNVGKSTLFNRLAGWRKAITLNTPGVTRDPIVEPVEWDGNRLALVDTGGLGGESQITLADAVHAHTLAAVEQADLLVVLFDTRAGVSPLDAETVEIVSRSRTPAIYVANKAESPETEDASIGFCELGIDPPLTISAEHGLGIFDLKRAIVNALNELGLNVRAEAGDPGRGPVSDKVGHEVDAEELADDDDDDPVDESAFPTADGLCSVALVGRPNVGKSSFLNLVAGRALSLVDAAPGTTRDVVDINITRGGREYVLLDTAGLRRPSNVERGIEKISARRSLDAVERADVVVLMIEPEELMTDQDARIARTAWENGKAVVIMVNKTDLISRRTSREAVIASLRADYASLSSVPIGFMSVVKEEGINRCFSAIDAAFAAYNRRFVTSDLNRILDLAAERKQPPIVSGGRMRMFYATQVRVRPPTIRIYTNRTKIPVHYHRYLENRIREAVDLEGSPLRILFKRRASH